ncbi:YkgJ family cysteine cluster protein [Peptococcaceae bacterium 1198_IL3148]
MTKAFLQGGPYKVGELLYLQSYPIIEDIINQKIIETSAVQGRKVTCTKGCDSCCHEQVLAQGIEGLVAAAWINKQPRSLRKNILKKLDKWMKELKNAGINLHLCSPEEIYSEANKYWESKIACPFLNNNICSIYPARPFACRTMLVASDPQECSKNKVNAVRVHSNKFEQLVRSEFLQVTGLLNNINNNVNEQQIANMVSWFPYITKKFIDQ